MRINSEWILDTSKSMHLLIGGWQSRLADELVFIRVLLVSINVVVYLYYVSSGSDFSRSVEQDASQRGHRTTTSQCSSYSPSLSFWRRAGVYCIPCRIRLPGGHRSMLMVEWRMEYKELTFTCVCTCIHLQRAAVPEHIVQRHVHDERKLLSCQFASLFMVVPPTPSPLIDTRNHSACPVT